MSRYPIDRPGVDLVRLAQQVGAVTAEPAPHAEGDDVGVAYVRFLNADGGEVDLDDDVVQQAIAAYTPATPADPNAELIAAIAAATTLQQLKDALIGKGKPAAVTGRPTAR